MIQFACPGCAGEHEVDEAYGGYEAKCSHCGLAFEIPSLDDEGEAEEQDAEVEQEEEPAFVPRVSPRERSRGPRSSELNEESAAPRWKKWVRDRRVQAGTGGISLVVLLIVLFSGGKKPAPVAAVPTPVFTPLPPVVKKEEPKVAIEAPPLPVEIPLEPTPPPIGLTLAKLQTELQFDPSALERYQRRPLEIQGLLEQASDTSLVISTGKGTPPMTGRYPTLPPFQAVLGVSARLPLPPVLPSGQSVTVRGVLMPDGTLESAAVISTATPADREWLGIPVEVEGIVLSVSVPKEAGRSAILELETPTSSRLKVEWAFKSSEAGALQAILPGQRVTLRGTCGGRSNLTVRFNDCQLLGPNSPANAMARRTSLDALCRDYEVDLVAMSPPILHGAPVTIRADQLAEAFQARPREAIEQYWGVPLIVTGVLVERREAEHLAYFEASTGHRMRVEARFTPSRFKAIGTQNNVQLRCVFSRLENNGVIRLDNCELADLEDPNAPRITADYLPLTVGQEPLYETVQYGKGKDHVTRQYVMKFADADTIQIIQLKLGAYAGKSLFQSNAPAVLWSKDPRNTGVPLFNVKYRSQYDTIEIGRPIKPEAGGKDMYWEPILKLGMKAGQTWKTTDPNGNDVTYTVVGFRKDKKDRDVVEVKRVALHPSDPSVTREETVIAYARGVGELGRSVTVRMGSAGPILLREDRIVEPGETTEGRLESVRPGQ